MIMQSVTRGNNFQWYTVNLCSCTEGYIFKLSIQSCEHEISGTLRLNDEMIRFQWSTGQGHWGLDVYHIIQRPPRWNVRICGAAGRKICVCVWSICGLECWSFFAAAFLLIGSVDIELQAIIVVSVSHCLCHESAHGWKTINWLHGALEPQSDDSSYVCFQWKAFRVNIKV